MRLLLDSHILLWAVAEPHRIPKRARGQIESPDNEVLFSAASIWELAIKMQHGRLDISTSLEVITEAATEMGFVELSVTARHAAGVRHLPDHHKDPFDRILVAQTIAEPARLLTVDSILGKYSDLVDVLS